MMSNVYEELAKLKFELRQAQLFIDKAILTSMDIEDSLGGTKKHLIDAINPKDYDLRNYLTVGDKYV